MPQCPVETGATSLGHRRCAGLRARFRHHHMGTEGVSLSHVALDLMPVRLVSAYMTRICTFLVLLLLVLTFNAYACLLPLQPESAMDCSSATEQPVRETCDAFLELGPQSHASFNQDLPLLKVDF